MEAPKEVIYSSGLSKTDGILNCHYKLLSYSQTTLHRKFGHFPNNRNQDDRAKIDDFDLPLTYMTLYCATFNTLGSSKIYTWYAKNYECCTSKRDVKFIANECVLAAVNHDWDN